MTEKKILIDAHCHVYPDAIARKAADATGTFYDGLPATCDGTVGELRRRGESAGITNYVVHSVATTPHQVHSINNFIAEVCRENPNMLGLGTLHPDGDIEKDMEHLLELGLHGVKLHPDIQRVAIDDIRCMPIYRICQREKLPLLLHTGDHRYSYSNPENLIPVLDKFPELTVVGAHFGGWSIWEEATKILCERKNFFVDCSSSFYALDNDKLMELIAMYGDDRVLFGTDYPMWDPADEVERYNTLPLGDEARENISWRNADRVFGFFK